MCVHVLYGCMPHVFFVCHMCSCVCLCVFVYVCVAACLALYMGMHSCLSVKLPGSVCGRGGVGVGNWVCASVYACMYVYV